MEKIKRLEAIEKGYKSYFTGIECKSGHIAKRQTSSGACYECVRLANKKIRDGAKNRRISIRRNIKEIAYKNSEASSLQVPYEGVKNA